MRILRSVLQISAKGLDGILIQEQIQTGIAPDDAKNAGDVSPNVKYTGREVPGGEATAFAFPDECPDAGLLCTVSPLYRQCDTFSGTHCRFHRNGGLKGARKGS